MSQFDFSCFPTFSANAFEYDAYLSALAKRCENTPALRSVKLAGQTAPLTWLLFKGLKRGEDPAALVTEMQKPSQLYRAHQDVHRLWAQGALSEMSSEIAHDSGVDPRGQVRVGRQPREEDQMSQAFEILASVWPEAHDQVCRLVTDVVWIDAHQLWSGSSPYAFGALFINPQPHWRVPHFFDSLLHESGHLALMIKQTRDPLLVNKYTKSQSPLRQDARPLIGILHAAFVLWRIREGLERYLSSSGPDIDTAVKLRDDYQARLIKAIDTLSEHSQFTTLGQRLFEDLRRRCALLRGA